MAGYFEDETTTASRPRSDKKTHSSVSLANLTLAAKRKISLLRPHAVNSMSQGKIAVIREDLQYFWQIFISVHGDENQNLR